MKAFRLLPLAGALLSSTALAQTTCPLGSTCVPPEDMRVFVKLAQEKKCLLGQAPAFLLDPITITVDREGRVYGSGSDPKPYKLKMVWCNYEIEGKGQTSIVVAQREEAQAGFRFRPKATIGYLPVTAFDKKDAYAGLDAGVLLEPAFISWFNLNAYVGARAFGGGLGFDVTKNMSLYLGYAMTWGTWQSNPHAAVAFALW